MQFVKKSCNISRVRHVVVLPKQLPTWNRIRDVGAMGLWCVTRRASFRFAGRSSKTPLKALTAPWVALTQQDRGWKFNFSQTSFPFYASPVRILISCRNHSVFICPVFWPRWVCNVVTLSTSYQTVIVSPQPPLLNAETIHYVLYKHYYQHQR